MLLDVCAPNVEGAAQNSRTLFVSSASAQTHCELRVERNPLYCDVLNRDATLSLLVHPKTPSDHLDPLTLINSYELIEITVLIVPATPSLPPAPLRRLRRLRALKILAVASGVAAG